MRTVKLPRWPCVIFLLALLVRLVYLYDNMGSPAFSLPIVDAATYHNLATDLVAGKGVGEGFFWQPFFYPAFLSVVYLVLGQSPVIVRLIQALVGSAGCVLVYFLGCRLFTKAHGVLAGAILAFYGTLIYLEGELLAAGWMTFWCTALVLLFLRSRDRASVRNMLLLGACGSLANLTRPTALPFYAVTCLWLVTGYWRRLGLQRATRLAGVLVVGFVAVSAPVASLNYRVTGHHGIIPSSGGFNFYLGNSPRSQEIQSLRPGDEIYRFYNQAAAAGYEGRRGSSEYFYGQAASYIRSMPFHFLRGLRWKAVQFLNSREIPRNFDVYVARKWSRVLTLLTWRTGGFGFPFGVLLPCAVWGILRHVRRLPFPVVSFLLLYPLVIILFFVTARYRIPVVPVLTVLAAAGVLDVWSAWRSRQWARASVALLLIVAVGTAVAFPSRFKVEETNFEAELHYCLGGALGERERLDEAAEQYQQALELYQENADARFNFGLIRARQDRLDEAVEQWTEITQFTPGYIDAYRMRARAASMQGDTREALRLLRKALEINPNDPKAKKELAELMGKEESTSPAR